MIKIQLPASDLVKARQWAATRTKDARHGRARVYGSQATSHSDLCGMLGELAVMHYLDLRATEYVTWRAEVKQHFDVPPPGAVQVRATSREHYGLVYIPAKNNCPWCPYILAFAPSLSDGTFYLRGWATGEQVEAEGKLIEHSGGNFYSLSTRRLHPLPKTPHPYFYLQDSLCRISAG